MASNFFREDNPYNVVMSTIGDLAMLSVAWFVGSIPIVTIGISTSAACEVARTMQEARDHGIFRGYIAAFRRRIGTNFALSLIIAAVWALAAFDLRFLSMQRGGDTISLVYGVTVAVFAILGVMLKGVDGGYDWSFFRDHLLEGELPRVGDSIRTKEILISRSVAREMGLVPGDKVEMLFVESEKSPRRDRFKVSGIYATGMDEFDRSVAMTDLRNVQRLADWSSDEVSGYEVTLADFSQAEDFSRRLNDMLLDSDREAFWDLTARSAQERFPTVFDWLKTHDVNAAVILVIMVVVAVFNMATALLTLVLERTRMIGLLKTMGMNSASLRRIFLYRALMLILRGVVWGNAIGLGICLLQYYFHLIPLDPEGYMLSEVPVAFGVGWWLALNAGVVAVILTLLMLPASIISQVKPVEAIRYDS